MFCLRSSTHKVTLSTRISLHHVMRIVTPLIFRTSESARREASSWGPSPVAPGVGELLPREELQGRLLPLYGERRGIAGSRCTRKYRRFTSDFVSIRLQHTPAPFTTHTQHRHPHQFFPPSYCSAPNALSITSNTASLTLPRRPIHCRPSPIERILPKEDSHVVPNPLGPLSPAQHQRTVYAAQPPPRLQLPPLLQPRQRPAVSHSLASASSYPPGHARR